MFACHTDGPGSIPGRCIGDEFFHLLPNVPNVNYLICHYRRNRTGDKRMHPYSRDRTCNRRMCSHRKNRSHDKGICPKRRKRTFDSRMLYPKQKIVIRRDGKSPNKPPLLHLVYISIRYHGNIETVQSKR